MIRAPLEEATIRGGLYDHGYRACDIGRGRRATDLIINDL